MRGHHAPRRTGPAHDGKILFKQLILSTLIHPTLILIRPHTPNSAIPQIFFHPSPNLSQIFTTHLFLPIFFIFLLHSIILSLFTNTHTSHSHPPSSSSSSQLSNLQVIPDNSTHLCYQSVPPHIHEYDQVPDNQSIYFLTL